MAQSDRLGATLMKKAGWESGKGLGRNEDGIVDHVKTVRKDNVLGIGYEGKVQQTWSAQSVGFADILKRINTQSPPPDSGESGDDEQQKVTTVSAGKHGSAYTKRRHLKTEALRSVDGKSEVLGAASSRSKRDREVDEDDEDRNNLRSPLLTRLMQRKSKHEPKPSAEGESAAVTITKPDPRPPKCTNTPFLMSS